MRFSLSGSQNKDEKQEPCSYPHNKEEKGKKEKRAQKSARFSFLSLSSDSALPRWRPVKSRRPQPSAPSPPSAWRPTRSSAFRFYSFFLPFVLRPSMFNRSIDQRELPFFVCSPSSLVSSSTKSPSLGNPSATARCATRSWKRLRRPAWPKRAARRASGTSSTRSRRRYLQLKGRRATGHREGNENGKKNSPFLSFFKTLAKRRRPTTNSTRPTPCLTARPCSRASSTAASPSPSN